MVLSLVFVRSYNSGGWPVYDCRAYLETNTVKNCSYFGFGGYFLVSGTVLTIIIHAYRKLHKSQCTILHPLFGFGVFFIIQIHCIFFMFGNEIVVCGFNFVKCVPRFQRWATRIQKHSPSVEGSGKRGFRCSTRVLCFLH